MSEAGTDHNKIPYYYDISSGQILIGGAAYDQHIEAGGHPMDVRDLGSFLRSDEEILHKTKYSTEFRAMPLEGLLEHLVWVRDILPTPERPKQRLLTKRVIERAGQLGLSATARQLTHPDRFGSMSRLFRTLGEKDTNIKYHHVTTAGALAYLRRLHDHLGRMPTVDELYEMSTKNPNALSYEVIADRIPGGLSKAAKEFGYAVLNSPQEYIDWGVDYYLANDQTPPSQTTLNVLSSVRKGPSHAGIKRKWTMEDYNGLVVAAATEALDRMTQQIELGRVPRSVTDPYDDVVDKLGSYTRYSLAKSFVPGLSDFILTKISKPIFTDRKFVQNLRVYKPNLTWDYVSEVSEVFGSIKNFWRIEYIKSLRVSAVIELKLKLSRGELNETDHHLADDAVSETALYMFVNSIGFLQPKTIENLQQAKVVPNKLAFERYYQEPELFRLMVMERLHGLRVSYAKRGITSASDPALAQSELEQFDAMKRVHRAHLNAGARRNYKKRKTQRTKLISS